MLLRRLLGLLVFVMMLCVRRVEDGGREAGGGRTLSDVGGARLFYCVTCHVWTINFGILQFFLLS